jgi:hypothetical protein
MTNERRGWNLGIRVYGLAAILLGVIGLVWDDFGMKFSAEAGVVADVEERAGEAARLDWPRAERWKWTEQQWRG